jgi:tetratricopeptide (TPR) repeat protein
MTAAEAEAFEDHFVACAECQIEVRLASAIIAGLPREADAPPSVEASRRAWIWGGGGLALAAGLATLMILRSGPRADLVALGGVREPPMYMGIPVRGAAGQDSLFEAAMDAYAQRRYSAAAVGLRAALAAGQDSVPAQFFLATILLLDDRASEAADEFQRVLAHGDTPYRAEAMYYRAKALLRLGRASEARAELARLSPADGVAYDMAKALDDSVAHRPNR